jgi:hypothetical protein
VLDLRTKIKVTETSAKDELTVNAKVQQWENSKRECYSMLQQTGNKTPVSELQQWFNEMEKQKTGNEYSSEIMWEWMSNCKPLQFCYRHVSVYLCLSPVESLQGLCYGLESEQAWSDS